MMKWTAKTFSQLTTNELYDFLKLRIDVFVVEQTCYYPDLDDLDRAENVYHLFCYDLNNSSNETVSETTSPSEMIAYCRVLPPDLVYDGESAIGRVIVSESARGKGVAKTLMDKALDIVDKQWPEQTCHISAQEYLTGFYTSLGFQQISDVYLEDGIPHIAMRREAKNNKNY